jgi:predicted  nucleic acid-binding Zn-ribbon protein
MIMARPYVTEVESNIQGGVKAKLGPKTLIVGPNRIGKSSIVRAIELATTGRASDVAGRDTLALDADLWTLAPAQAESIGVEVYFSNENRSEWSLVHGKKSKRVGPAAIFPLRDVRSAILGSAETARKFFLSVAGRVSWEDVIAEIPPQFHTRLASYAPKGMITDGATALLAAIEGTKKRVREINAEVRAQRATVASASVGLGPPPSAAEVAAAKLASEASARTAQLGRATDRLTEIDAEAQRIGERLRLAQTTHADLTRRAAALPPALPEIVAQAMAVGEYHLAHDVPTCAICGGDAKPIRERVERAKKAIANAVAQQRAHEAITAEVRSLTADLRVMESDARRLSAERESLLAIVGTKTEILPTADAGDRYAAIVATAAKWEAVRQAEGRAVELEAEAAVMSQLPTVCSTALERLLDKMRSAFVARVQKYLPAAMKFGVELRDGDREVFRFGLLDFVPGWPDGKPSTPDDPAVHSVLRTALSGAEWATVTAALAAAVAESAPADAPVIIVPEDRDYDPVTLAWVMESFTKIDGQVILATTKKPSYPVDGWTIIDLGPTDLFGA